MQRKTHVAGATALLAVLVTGCTTSSGTGASPDDSKPNETTASSEPAPPGKYRTLPEACSQVGEDTLDTMLPGIKDLTDEKQREQAYEGTATLTYDTDRRVGCRWTGESPFATDHLLIDFERVVSYDTTVSDDTRAEQVFASKEKAAGVSDPDASGTPNAPGDPETPGTPDASHAPDSDGSRGAGDSGTAGAADGGGGLSPDSTTSPGASDDPSGTGGDGGDGGADAEGDSCGVTGGVAGGASSDGSGGSDEDGDGESGGDSGAGGSKAQGGPRSRVLDDLGDTAFLDDSCATPSSAARHRTVTVVFRTSNVIVTVEYDEQPSRPADIPDSAKMQDTAEELAHELADGLSG